MKKLILLALVFSSVYGFSQKQPVYYDAYQPVKRSSIQFNIGPTAFHGDADQTKLGIFAGLGYKYSFSPAFGLCFGGNFGTLRGSRDKSKISLSGFGNSWDKDADGDAYSFKNKFWDVDLTAHLILSNLSFVRKPKPSHFYILAGLGFMGNNVTGDVPNDLKQDLYNGVGSNDTTFSYKGINSKVPIGFGFSKKITNKLDLGIEYKYNLTKKDLLDAFSFPVWANRTFDSYSFVGLIHGSYKLGKTDNEQHMDWISPTQKIVEEGEKEIADSDSDGVADKFDAEPATPKGAQVYGNGVAIDSDGDKVPDYRDDEKLSPCDQVDEKGKAFDTDGDGVPDCKDEETDTPAGSLVDKNGRKVEIKSGASGSGSCCDCNDVTLPSVFVDEDNEFRPEAFVAIYLIGTKMQQCPDLSIDIIGYYGMNKSSEQSARSKTNVVIEYLVTNFGISRSKFNVQTKPETMGGKYSKQRIDIKAKK